MAALAQQYICTSIFQQVEHGSHKKISNDYIAFGKTMYIRIFATEALSILSLLVYVLWVSYMDKFCDSAESLTFFGLLFWAPI